VEQCSRAVCALLGLNGFSTRFVVAAEGSFPAACFEGEGCLGGEREGGLRVAQHGNAATLESNGGKGWVYGFAVSR